MSRFRGRRAIVQKSNNLRKQISSSSQLGFSGFTFTLLQVIIPVVSLALQPRLAHRPFNEDQSQGRVMCDSGSDMKASLRITVLDVSHC
jgi:hypothetical protein